MNGYERIKAALSGEKPDCLPVMLHNFLPAAREAGFTQEVYRNNPDNIAETFIKAVESYGYDGVLVDLDTVTLAGAVGVPVDFPEDEPATSHEPCLNTLEDVSSLKPVNIENYRYIQVWLEAVRKLSDHFGNEVFLRGNCDQAPFSLASMMRTPGEWMMDLYDEDNRDFVEELLEFCTGITCQFIRLMSGTGAHMVSNGDSPAGPAMISPSMYERLALPYERKVIECAHSRNISYALHICGDTTPILDMMVRTGTDALELDCKTDTRKAHDVFKDRVTFIGNIDPSGVLALGTEDDVRMKTRELIRVFSDTNRFILNAGCALPVNTPGKNIHALIRTAREYSSG